MPNVAQRPGMVVMLGIGTSLLASWPWQAAAVESTYGLGYSAVLSNNMGRTRDNPQRDWMNVASGVFTMREVSDWVDAHLYSQAQYRQFMEGTFDDGFLFALDGAGTFVLSPKRFTWTAEDRFTQVPIDPSFVLTPQNTQNINTFSTGPNFIAHLDPVDDLELGGRYSNIYYETSLLNSNRYSAYGRLNHAFSPITRASLNYEPSRVEYSDRTINPDYTRHDVFGRLGFRWPTTDFMLDAGTTRIDMDNNFEVQQPLLRATFSRRLNSTSSIAISGSRELGDAGAANLLVSPNPALDGISPIVINPNELTGGGIYDGHLADASFLHHRDYGDDRAHVFWRRLQFETAPLFDEHIWGAIVEVGQDFSGALTGTVFGDYARTEYVNALRTDQDRGYGARIIYRIQRQLALTVEARWSERDSTLLSMNYNELRGVVTLSYASNPLQAPDNPFLNYVNPLYR